MFTYNSVKYGGELWPEVVSMGKQPTSDVRQTCNLEGDLALPDGVYDLVSPKKRIAAGG